MTVQEHVIARENRKLIGRHGPVWGCTLQIKLPFGHLGPFDRPVLGDVLNRCARMLRHIVLFACLTLLPTSAFGAGAWTLCRERQPEYVYYSADDALIPGITWDTWRVLLHQDWSPADRVRPGWSDTEAMIRAAQQAPLDTDYQPSETELTENYVPQAQATTEQQNAYATAAMMFHAGSMRAAIAAFDAIASSSTSPYAAAAAYSAARAALDIGDFADGISRVGRIIADPAMQDMHKAAHHLVSTIAYQTGASPLIAARFADLTHLLLAPREHRCRNTELYTLMKEANTDLDYIFRDTFPTNRFDNLPPWSRHTRDILASVAQYDPVADLIQVLAAPTPFNRNGAWIEPFYPEAVPYPGFSLEDQASVAGADENGPARTAHARERARETGNPLWAYALAIRTTDPADLPILEAAKAAASLNNSRGLAGMVQAVDPA